MKKNLIMGITGLISVIYAFSEFQFNAALIEIQIFFNIIPHPKVCRYTASPSSDGFLAFPVISTTVLSSALAIARESPLPCRDDGIAAFLFFHVLGYSSQIFKTVLTCILFRDID
jgi:hypothetical protein